MTQYIMTAEDNVLQDLLLSSILMYLDCGLLRADIQNRDLVHALLYTDPGMLMLLTLSLCYNM